MIKIFKKNKGFAILFAVTLSSILLAITLGVTEIAFREIKFSTSATATNEAFFAADTGTELVLFNDKTDTYPAVIGSIESWGPIIISNIGGQNSSCAIVTITKDYTGPSMITTIVSKGYNLGDAMCESTNPNRIEREIETRY